jgi:hypothetical protein
MSKDAKKIKTKPNVATKEEVKIFILKIISNKTPNKNNTKYTEYDLARIS